MVHVYQAIDGVHGSEELTLVRAIPLVAGVAEHGRNASDGGDRNPNHRDPPIFQIHETTSAQSR